MNLELSPDKRFVRYDSSLGDGSLKDVYKSFDTIDGKIVAWNKVNIIDLPSIYEKNIINEITILKELKNKNDNILNISLAWKNKYNYNEYNFITEFVTGGSLYNYINDNKLIQLKLIKKWGFQILSGINFLHNNEIIHRDIKPGNIFVDMNSGNIKIGDFGCAIKFKENDNKLVGTPQFIALEILEGDYNYKVDIYAFGMTMLQLCTNKTPYEECKTKEQIWKKIYNDVKPTIFNKRLKRTIYDFILNCINNINDRAEINQLLKHDFFINNEEDNYVLDYSLVIYDRSNDLEYI